MQFHTSKFGSLEIDSQRIILFPDGIVGFESHRHWVLLSEDNDDSIGWLQSLSDSELAFLVVTPQRFVEGYEMKLHRSQLLTVPWSREDRSLTLAIVSDHDGTLTANLKAPILLNVDRCLGRQVIVADDQPLQHVLYTQPAQLRKSA
jgi:flagellar assembly factor FliW